MIDTMLDLVTGGAGFIGSHLTDRLLALGRTVRVVDNMAVGNPRNLEQHKANPRLEVRVADVADPDVMAGAMTGVERVFHLAALADIVPSIQNPEGYFRPMSSVRSSLSRRRAQRLSGDSSTSPRPRAMAFPIPIRRRNPPRSARSIPML